MSRITDQRLTELISLAAQDPGPLNDWLTDTDAALRELELMRPVIEQAQKVTDRWVVSGISRKRVSVALEKDIDALALLLPPKEPKS